MYICIIQAQQHQSKFVDKGKPTASFDTTHLPMCHHHHQLFILQAHALCAPWAHLESCLTPAAEPNRRIPRGDAPKTGQVRVQCNPQPPSPESSGDVEMKNSIVCTAYTRQHYNSTPMMDSFGVRRVRGMLIARDRAPVASVRRRNVAHRVWTRPRNSP
jgi:hypothetical protein